MRQKRSGLRRGGFGVLLCLVISSSAFGTLYIQNGQLWPYYVDWYHGDSNYFQTNFMDSSDPAILIDGTFDVTGDQTPEYELKIDTGANYFGYLASSQIAMVNDVTPNGGRAKGYFSTTGSITVSGELIRISDGNTVANGTLFTAEISSSTWFLEEQATPVDSVRGSLEFTVTGGLLSDPDLNDDDLVLLDFICTFTFPDCDPSITDFEDFSGTYFSQSPTVQMGALPEPTTVLLLGLGGLALARRRD